MTADETENRHQDHPDHQAHQDYHGREGHEGGWQPLPAGEYDGDATAFVQLPPGAGLDGFPLEAPGHGFVPPEITDPHATAQWNFHEAMAAEGPPPAPAPPAERPYPQAPPPGGTELTGQWTIPVAQGDLPEESGEYRLAAGSPAAVPDWSHGTPPATLPGGAPAPWAPTPTAEPGAQAAPDAPQADAATAGSTDAPGAAAPADLPEPPAPPAPGPGAAAAPEAAVPAGSPVPPGGTAPEAAPFNPGVPAPEATGGHGHPAEPDEGAGPGAPTGPEHAPDTGGTPQDGTSGAAGASADPDGAGTHHTDARPDGPVPTGAPAPQDAPAAPEPGDALPQDAPRQPDAPPPAAGGDEHPHVSYVLRVNGADRPVSDAWIGESLLYVLRERLGLAGAKDGCSQGECGACNVQVDGRLVASCLVPAATAAGSEVRTVEGLAARGEPSDVQRALARCGAVQCGFCIPGMAMTLHDLLEGNHAPSDVEARRALSGNLCRCTGYQGALRAVQEVVAERRAAARAASGAGDEQPPEVRIPHQLPHPHDGGTA